MTSSTSEATVPLVGAARQPAPPVSLAQLKIIARDRIQKVYRFRSRSAKATGEQVDLGQVMDRLMEAFVRSGALYFREAHRELNARFPGAETNRRRLSRWLPVLVQVGILDRDSMGRYCLAIACEPTPQELDGLYPRNVLEASTKRVVAELVQLRQEIHEMRSIMTLILRLVSEKSSLGPPRTQNQQP